MGLDARFTNNHQLDSKIEIDPDRHRALGMHACEYAQRHQLSDTELLDMLSMIGLRDGYAD